MLKLYKEGREYKTPVKGKDGFFYNLYWYIDDKEWVVDRMSGKAKSLKFARTGGWRLEDDRNFENYKKAWEFFKRYVEGKAAHPKKK